MYYFYCTTSNFAYYASGGNCVPIRGINAEAKRFADLIGVDVETVYFDGRIDDSVWIKNYYLFAAFCPNLPGEQFVKVKLSRPYIRFGEVG